MDMSALTFQLRRIGTSARQTDRVLLAACIILAAIFIFDAPQFVPSLQFTAESLVSTAPFLVLSIGIAAYATATGADNLISRAFAGRPVRMVFTAAALARSRHFAPAG